MNNNFFYTFLLVRRGKNKQGNDWIVEMFFFKFELSILVALGLINYMYKNVYCNTVSKLLTHRSS